MTEITSKSEGMKTKPPHDPAKQQQKKEKKEKKEKKKKKSISYNKKCREVIDERNYKDTSKLLK